MPRTTRLAVLLLLALLPVLAAAAPPVHDLIRLDISTPAGLEFVRANRGALDVVYVRKGLYAEVAADARTRAFLDAAGRTYEVVTKDLEASLAAPDKGPGFGIFHTYSESAAWVDSLRLQYPHVISNRWTIGQSWEGRDIWAFRVSANPDVDEDEPEILIDGLHHAREIMAAEFPVMFAEHLARNYGVDPEITWLLDHRELYVVPIVNPDGFVYNETTYPAGGGMWRKNRRPNMDGTFGVDLNRNYPYQWGFDDFGSSGDPSSETYRGQGPASELEVQAMMNFVNGREIRTHDTVHTYSNLTLYPWGYTDTPAVHGDVFAHMAAEMTKENGYEPGQPGVILYDVNGGAFDWMYGDASKHTAVFSFSNEIGGSGDGFWPDESRRGPLFEENVWPHLYLMRVAGSWVSVGAPVLVDGPTPTLDFSLTNDSVVESLLSLALTVSTDDPWVQLGDAHRTVGSLASLGTTTLPEPLPFSVDPACPDGHEVVIHVTLHLPDGDLAQDVSFLVGAPVFADDFESGTGAWTLGGLWDATTEAAASPTHSLTDSPGADYQDDFDTAAELTVPVQADLLRFRHTYAIERDWDFGRVLVGAGGVWTEVRAFTGFQAAWQPVEFDLAPWAGQDVSVRFLLDSDYSIVEDGWHIDDVELLRRTDGDEPTVPEPMSPVAGGVLAAGGELVVANSTDPLGGTPAYGFRVYADADCTVPVAEAATVPAGAGQTAWSLPTLADGNYWWRAWSETAAGRSDLSPARRFNLLTSTPVGDALARVLDLRVLDGISGGRARVRLTLPGLQDARVDVYDARGARIRRLLAGPADGTRTLVWDGRDDGGRAVASGLYFVRLTSGAEQRVGRVVVVR